MRKLIKYFVKICAETLPISEPIYEFGSLQVPGQEGFANLRPLFPNKKYNGADMQNGPGVDVILNLHNISLPKNSVGTVLVLDTFEHVEYPRKAIKEIHRILKPNGLFIMSSVMNFPIHSYPYDYWRFTPDGFKSLLKPFAYSFVDSIGTPEFPHTIVSFAFKSPTPDNIMTGFMKQFNSWKQYWDKTHPPMWKRVLKAFVPPIIPASYQRIRYLDTKFKHKKKKSEQT